jgi:uncharacterized damage-inducible protein DinB
MNDFKEQAVFRMGESLERILLCINKLSEEALWQKPNSQSNSVGNLTLHLCGNIRQYIYSTLAENNDDRNRSTEFLDSSKISSNKLKIKIQETIENAIYIIRNLDDSKLQEQYSVQGFNLSGTGIILHVVEHLSYHTGQIALLCKLQTNEDLGFYKDMNLD